MQLVEGFENQVKRVFDNLKAVCEAAGGSLNDLVKVNVFLIDLAHFAKVNEIMASYISQPYPARAAIGVASSVNTIAARARRSASRTVGRVSRAKA